jgi:CheY-like chemotaxis protein
MREFYREWESPLALVPVQLNDLVQHVKELTRARWSDMPQRRGIVIRLEEELTRRLSPVMGVENEIREALVNLIFNSVDAQPDGGTITIRTSSTQDGVALEITDTGTGMDEATKRRCLEPFFTTKGERGTGLGLAMVYGMAQRHGAEILIASEVGKGTSVRLVFPASTPAPVASTAPALVRSRGRHVLVVDDDALLIRALTEILETDGHYVVPASGGQEGIDVFDAHLQREPFDLVITDLGMPHVDGRKVAAHVKHRSSHTPVVLFTGWGQRLVAENETPPHVDRILNKPPKLHDLRSVVAELTAEEAEESAR